MKNLKFISDPGHGWLSVSHKQLEESGVASKISPFSYMNASRVFLEEDCDAGLFLAAMEAKGITFNIKESYTEKFNRSLASYNQKFLNPFDGMQVILAENGNSATMYPNRNELVDYFGNVYRLRKSNPFVGLKPL